MRAGGEKENARKIIVEWQATAARLMLTATNCQYETATGSRLSLIVYKEWQQSIGVQGKSYLYMSSAIFE